jgi:hypothetical protein
MTTENQPAENQPAKDQSVPFDPVLDEPLWGAVKIGKEANLPPSKAFRMLELKLIDGTKVGDKWQSTRRRIHRSLGNI